MEINGETEIYGVIGNPIKHSLSPIFQNEALKSTGMNAVYLPFELPKENFDAAFRGILSIKNLKGCNITLPFKEKVLNFGKPTEDVIEIGSANTIKKTEEEVILYNTDWLGFLSHLKELINPKNKRVLILGAGGTARAVIYALKKVNAEIYLWNRTFQKALNLSERFQIRVLTKINNLSDFDIIVNTTSVGLKDDDKPLFDYSLIEPGMVVYDVIYKETPLIKAAKQKGAVVSNGLKMLLYQGLESLRIWTGKRFDANKLWKKLKTTLKTN